MSSHITKNWRNPHPSLYMNGVQVSPASDHIHLGSLLSGTWQSHIEYMTAKAWKRINIMRKLKFDLDRKVLETIYFSFIRPILEFADIVWTTVVCMKKIRFRQKDEAARIVNGATKLVSLNVLHNDVC